MLPGVALGVAPAGAVPVAARVAVAVAPVALAGVEVGEGEASARGVAEAAGVGLPVTAVEVPTVGASAGGVLAAAPGVLGRRSAHAVATPARSAPARRSADRVCRGGEEGSADSVQGAGR